MGQKCKPANDACQTLPEGCKLLQDGQFSQLGFKNNQYFQQTMRFLAGMWIEDYIYHTLKAGIKDPAIGIEKDFIVTKEGWKTDFELDLVIVNKSRFIGIHATTSKTRSVCKSKGFELLVRTQQIADNADAILVTCLESENRMRLEQELQISPVKKDIIVLGMNDLLAQILLDRVHEFICK